MLTVVGQQKAAGRTPPENNPLLAQEAEAVSTKLATFRESLPHRHRAEVTEKLLSANVGVAYVESSRVSVATRAGTTVIFCGNLEAEDESGFVWGKDTATLKQSSQPCKGLHCVKQVLDAYRKSDWGSVKEETVYGKAQSPKARRCNPAKLFGRLRGSFAFVIWDAPAKRLVAARDQNACEPMFWGAPTFGDGLLFSTERALVEEEAADADQFPPGTFFALCPGDGTNSTGVIKSFELGLDSDNEVDKDEDASVDRMAEGSEGSMGMEWESVGGANEQQGIWEPPKSSGVKRGVRASPNAPLPKLNLLKKHPAIGDMDGQESSSEEEVLRKLHSSPRSLKAARSPRKPAAQPWGSGRILLQEGPVSPRTAVRRAVTSVMKRMRLSKEEGRICRPSSGENLASLGGHQIQAK